MPADPRLMALPALRKRAEEQARETRAMLVDLADRHDPVPWEGTLAQANLTLISDLSRPASRWELAALISERLGWDAVETLYSIERGFPNLIALYRAAKVPTPPGYDPNPTPEEAITALALAVLGGAS